MALLNVYHNGLHGAVCDHAAFARARLTYRIRAEEGRLSATVTSQPPRTTFLSRTLRIFVATAHQFSVRFCHADWIRAKASRLEGHERALLDSSQSEESASKVT